MDLRTLLVAIAVATAFSALARLALYRLHPSMPGLGRWAWAAVVGAVALLLIAGMNVFPPGYRFVVPQLLIAVSYCLAWDGFLRFLGRPPLKRSIVVAVLVIALAPTAITFFGGVPGMHSAVNTGLMAALSASIARELLGRRAGKGLAIRVTGWLYVANAVFFALRALQVIFIGHSESLEYTPFAAAALLWWLCMTVAVTLCMALMIGEKLEAELRAQASRDPLTGALNRRAFALVTEPEMARARRSGAPLSLLVMDLDHFKRINDKLGHAFGDRALCRFVDIALTVLRAEDVFCRFGGEEFVALLPGGAAEDALPVAERIRNEFATDSEVSAWRSLDPAPLPFTVSIGVAELRPGEALDDLIRRADLALYRAKAEGRDRVCVADSEGVGPVAFQHGEM